MTYKITIRKKDAGKTKKALKNIFGGSNCGSYDTQVIRRACNDIIRKNIDINPRHIHCYINGVIEINGVSIQLGTKMGKGVYGNVYLSRIEYKKKSYDIIIKQQNVISKPREVIIQKELLLIKYLSLLVQKNVSPHFLHYYTDLTCEYNDAQHVLKQTLQTLEQTQQKLQQLLEQIEQTQRTEQTLKRSKETKELEKTGQILQQTGLILQKTGQILQKTGQELQQTRQMTHTEKSFHKYIKMFIVEKASGAFSELKNTIEDDFNSIISQIIISIYTFHQYTKCYHCDTHYENFLYHELLHHKNTYIKYKLGDDIYNLKLSKYLIILWDYGLAKSMENTDILKYAGSNITYMLDDYLKIFNIIYDEKNYDIYDNDNIGKLENILDIFEEYDEKLADLSAKNTNHDLKLQYMLKLEKEMIYHLIRNKYIFADDIFSADYVSYNGTPYELENIHNYYISIT